MDILNFDDVNDFDGMPEAEESRIKITPAPNFNEWTSDQFYDYKSSNVDYETLENLDKSFAKLRKAIFIVNDKINEYERQERKAKKIYERHYKREYLLSTEKTESAKKARADIKCEELENKWMEAEQFKNELVRMSFTLNRELQILQTMAYNHRAQLKM